MERFTELLDLQALATAVVNYIPDVLAALAILILFRILFSVTSVAFRKVLQKSGVHETLTHMLVDNVYRYAVYIFGFVMAADQLGINVAAALAGIGVAGIAVGFAAQDTLSNIIAGFLIFIDKPFEVDDWVEVGDESGLVTTITMRTTRMRTRNNTYIVIPNKKIIDEVLVNHSKHGATRIDTPLGIAYKEDIREARKVILAAIESMGDKRILPDPPPFVVVTELAGSSVNLEARLWTNSPDLGEPIISAVTEAAKIALDEAGIEIPYPHLQLFIDDVRPPVWEDLKKFRAAS